MKKRTKLSLALCSLATACGPIALDITASMGANQDIKKTLEIKQVQTDAQANAQSGIIDGIVSVIPLFASQPSPTPTPVPQRLKSITVEVEPAVPTVSVVQATPTPSVILIEPKLPVRRKLAARKLPVATPTPCPVTDEEYRKWKELNPEYSK